MNIYQVIASHWEAAELMTGIPVFAGDLPQDYTLGSGSAGTFSLVSGPSIVTHDGGNNSRNEIWQFAGLNYYLYDAADVREKIRQMLVDIPGDYDGITVQSCIPARSPRDIRDTVKGFWMAIQEFQLFYTVEE